jgi:methane/ammonia monooxygenase subunit C
MLTLSAIFVSVRLYQQFFAWTTGLDSSTPEFQTHWMRLLYGEFFVEGVAAAAIWGWLWKTRDRNLAALEPSEEIKRYLRLIGWLLMYVFAVYWAEFFAEQDATWHQTVVRDTEFTPSHIALFFGAMPVFIIMGVSSYLYARTRIPQFARGHSVPFVIAVAGPFMMLPNVGFNEWGHTFCRTGVRRRNSGIERSAAALSDDRLAADPAALHGGAGGLPHPRDAHGG